MLLEVHQGDGAQVSFHLAPLWRLSAFLFDLSLHMKNLNLIFPSWAKLEEGQCFIKGLFIPQAATVFFIYIQRKSAFLFLRKCFQKLSLRKVNPIRTQLQKEREKKTRCCPAPPRQRTRARGDQLSRHKRNSTEMQSTGPEATAANTHTTAAIESLSIFNLRKVRCWV